MDSQDSTAESDTIFDKRMEAKAMPLSLLKRITDDFSDNLEIGRGLAVVYKGLLENRAVAVKTLSEASDIDERKFLGEVDCVMKAKHKNIVQFLGYCSDTQGQWMQHNGKSVMADVRHRLLCFEYLPNGSLDKCINDSSREWEKCYQIIKGVCKGLHYLHEKGIVHSDLKPANILLDDDMVPKTADFGVSRCFDEKQTHVTTKNIIVSLGYAAPEYLNGKISFKSDIFSLGIIIIEMLTAKKDYPNVKDVLECWMLKVEKSQKEQQVEQIRVCTEVGQRCLDYDPAKRPSAQDIIDILEQTESKERRIDTGSISSTVPRASSLIENKNQSNRPPAEKKSKSIGSTVPQASSFARSWAPMDAVSVARALKAVTQYICLSYAQDIAELSFYDLYMHGYHLVIDKKGEELYSAVEATLTSEVQSLCRTLEAAPTDDDALFLQELLTKWNLHVTAVQGTSGILSYMDQAFVPANRKTPIRELGLRLWRDHLVCSDKIRPRLVDAVKQQRGSEDELVDGVNKMLTELGEDVVGLFFPDGELHVAGP